MQTYLSILPICGTIHINRCILEKIGNNLLQIIALLLHNITNLWIIILLEGGVVHE